MIYFSCTWNAKRKKIIVLQNRESMNYFDVGALNRSQSDGRQRATVVPIVSLNCISLVDQKLTLNGVT